MKNFALTKLTAIFALIIATGLVDGFVGNTTVALLPVYMIAVSVAAFYLGLAAGLASALFVFFVMLLAGVQIKADPSFILMLNVFSYLAVLIGAVVFIDKYRSRAQSIADIEQKKEYDNALAKEVHQSVFVPAPKDNRYLTIGNKMIFTPGLGGDYYYMADMGDKVFYTIADISGKSIASALFSVILHENTINSLQSSDTLADIIQSLNSKIYMSLPEDMFVTMFCCFIDDESITYVNAAHEPPLLYSKKRKATFLLQNEDSLPIGLSPFLELKEKRLEFDSNDIFLAVSDGVTESDLFIDKPYDKLSTSLRQTADGSAQLIAEDIYERAAMANPNFPLCDIIITCVKRKRKI